MIRGDTFDSLMSVLREPVVIASCVRDETGSIVDFSYEFLNVPAASILGRPPSELIGRRMSEVLAAGTRGPHFAAYCRVVETGEAVDLELPDAEPGGEGRAWEVSVTKLADGFVAVGHDVTARALDTQRLRDRERLYRVLADYAAEVAGLSVGGMVVWVAPSITNLLGWSVEEFVGRSIASFIHPDDMPTVQAFRQEIDTVGPRRVRCRMRHKDGSWRWIETSSRKTADEDGGLDDTVVSMLWDVQAEVDAVEALRRAEAERVEMEARVQRAERLDSLGVLAGGVAHDFNNLLMGVMGNAELALLRVDDPTTRRLLDQIVTATQRAADLTRQMLDYAGRRTLESRLVGLAEIVDETLQLARTTMSRSASVTVEVPSDLPPVVGDPGQLRQVVLNLALNASDAVDSLEAGPRQVTIRGWTADLDAAEAARLSPGTPIAPGRYVVLAVADNGPGMSAETVHRIFEPFFTTKPTGKGLGLSVVFGVVRSLGGTTEVVSELGLGTTVRVFLPAGSHVHTSSGPAAPVAPVRKVLVIDDDALVLDVVTETLTACGYDVLGSSSASEAIAAFTARPGDFAVALIDVTMPEMNGTEALSALREVRPDIPGVMMSGYSRAEIRMGDSDAHTGFLQKPFGIDMLLDAMAAAFAAPTDA